MTDTTDPFTLRDAAGLPTTPEPLARSALVIIDAQLEYVTGPLALPAVEDALTNIARLQAAARETGRPVIHVAHQGRSGGIFDPAAGGQFIEETAPITGETIVTKKLPNAFADTDLAAQLEALGRPPVILAGFMTHMCVSATARAALDLGFDATVSSDATTTRSLPSAVDQGPIDSTVVHETALAELADRFSLVATTDEVLAAP